MVKIAALRRLPKFVRDHHLARFGESEVDGEEGYRSAHEPETNIHEAHLVTSATGGTGDTHRPILDIDFPAALIPSTTPGHFHLYLDKEIPADRYFMLLRTLANAGIIEEGYANASIERGYTAARLPWIRKQKLKLPASAQPTTFPPAGDKP